MKKVMIKKGIYKCHWCTHNMLVYGTQIQDVEVCGLCHKRAALLQGLKKEEYLDSDTNVDT